MPNIASIFVPRIKTVLTQKKMTSIVHERKIGSILNLEMHINKNTNDQYYYAFMVMEFYDNPLSTYFYENIQKRGSMYFIYDIENQQCWEFKKHISHGSRCSSPVTLYDDRNSLAKEYEDMQREIFQLCCIP
jgi:hypothetical protein